MQFLRKDCRLEFNNDTLYNARKVYNLHRTSEMVRAVDILEEWVKQQKHFLKKDFSRELLERIIIMSKGSIERAKKRLDNSCTFRSLMPKFYIEYDIKNDFKEFDGILHQALLPKVTDDDCRIYMLRNTGKKFETTLLYNYLRTMILFLEYLRDHDYAKSYIVILDYRETNLMELASKLNLGEMRQGVTLLTEGYGVRLKALHVLSDSKLVDGVVKILKQVMSTKLGSRIQVHKSLDELYSFISPKEVLPVEYGGKERPLFELNDEWYETFGSEEFKKIVKDMSKAGVDESRRPTDKFNEQYMGMPGTFRSMNLD